MGQINLKVSHACHDMSGSTNLLSYTPSNWDLKMAIPPVEATQIVDPIAQFGKLSILPFHL